MVKKAAKVLLVALCIGGIAGCASQASVDALRSEIDSVSKTANDALSEARTARELSQQANARAREASKEANEAAAMAEDTNSKLDRMFKKSHDEINSGFPAKKPIRRGRMGPFFVNPHFLQLS